LNHIAVFAIFMFFRSRPTVCCCYNVTGAEQYWRKEA